VALQRVIALNDVALPRLVAAEATSIISDEDKPAAAVREQQAQSINGRVRRGLALSNEELMALVVEAYGVGGDPVIVSGQTAEEYAERI
jgi:hypothetical protein